MSLKMRTIPFILLLFSLVFTGQTARADDSKVEYASLRKSEVYVRYGPSQDHPIKWIYRAKSLPVKVNRKFDQWRKIEDISGDTGWVHAALLTSKKTALISSDAPYVLIRKKPESNSTATLRVEPGNILNISECEGDYCKVSISGYKGYVEKNVLWGIE